MNNTTYWIVYAIMTLAVISTLVFAALGIGYAMLISALVFLICMRATYRSARRNWRSARRNWRR